MNQPEQPYQGPTQFPGGQQPPPSGGYTPPSGGYAPPPQGGYTPSPSGAYPVPGSYSGPPDHGRPVPGGSGSGGGGKGLVLALVGLVVGAGLGIGGGYLIFSGDPTDSDEYAALQSDLTTANDRIEELEGGEAQSGEPEIEPGDPAEPAESPTESVEPAEPAEPESESGLAGLEGWSVTEPVIGPDSVDDYIGEFSATNEQAEAASILGYISLLSGGEGGELVVELSCYSDTAEPGATIDVRCISYDDYVPDSWDTLVYTETSQT